MIWNYGDADMERACELIDETNWDTVFKGSDVDCCALSWWKKIMEIMESCIPKQVITRMRNVPWLSQHLIRKIRKKNSLYFVLLGSHVVLKSGKNTRN